MIPYQPFQLFLFLQHGPPNNLLLLILTLSLLLNPPRPLPPPLPFITLPIPNPLLSTTNSLRPHIILHSFLLPPLIPNMIHTQHPPHNTRPSQIIHRQIRTPLILILQKSKPSALTRVLVADEVEMDGFSELGEDGYDVAFAEVVGEAADVDEGCVSVVGVP